MSEGSHSVRQTVYICVAIVAAIVLAMLSPTTAMRFDVGGEVFLNVLKMMVVPLVMTSVMCGILGMGDVRKLGKPGLYTIIYYVSTTFLAVLVGLVAVNIIRPGVGTVDADKIAEIQQESGETKEKMSCRLGRRSIWMVRPSTRLQRPFLSRK